MLFLAAVLAAAMGFLLLLLFFFYVRHVRRRDMFYRLRKQHVLEGRRTAERKNIFEWMRETLTETAAPIVERRPAQALDAKMRQAGIPLLGGEFLVAVFVVAAFVAVFLWMLTMEVFAAVLAAFFVLALFWIFVTLRIYRRRAAFTEQLGDCLTTVANALRAGYSFQQAMDVIAREMEPPISEEFSQVTREVSMSVPLEIALESMSERVGSSDFDLVVTAVLIQREVGGNLAQILDNISDTINERIRMKREIHTLTAQGRMSAWILLLLPSAIGLFMYIVNPSQVMLLFEEPLGRMALGISFGLEIVGYIVIQRIVNIEM